MSRRLPSLLTLAAMCMAAAFAQASEIAHISSSSGYVLDDGGGAAVTAAWKGQRPLAGFSGYGQVRLNNRCLSTNGPAGQQLRWDTCRSGDKAQVWALNNRQLNNELGWCADVEGNRQGAGVRVLAWQCSRAVNQQFKAHVAVSAQTAAARIADHNVRQIFLQTAQTAKPGSVISPQTGRLIGVDGGSLIAAGGMNLVVTSNGNLIAAGGLN